MVINQLPDIIKLLTQIMFSDVTENVKYRAVYIFETICASCDRIRKHLQEIISQFIRDCIVPNIAMKQEDIDTWLVSEKDYEYEDNSLQAICEDAIENISATLGKQVIFPIMKDFLTQALHKQDDARLVIAAIEVVKYASENLNSVLKQSDVNNIVQSILDLSHSTNARIRYDCVDCLTIISNDLNPKVAKMHKKIIPRLIELTDDENKKVRMWVIFSLCGYAQILNYEQTYDYSEQLFAMVRKYFNVQDSMKAQTGALQLLATLCDTIDKEDIIPLLQ